MDTIGDMITSIRNASAARRTAVRIPWSSQKQRIAEVLRKEGYVGPVSIATGEKEAHKLLEVTLKYEDGKAALSGIKRISKQSRRWYVRKSEIPSVLSGMGVAVISTSQGLMTGSEARKRGLGGEVICTVW